MKKNNKKGFTLVELVIVVAVMAILVAVAVPTVSSITKSATDSVNNSNARTIESVIKVAEANKANSGTADGAGSLSDTEIDKALTEAKLGIDKDATFLYNTVSGKVTYDESAAASTTEMVITFDADGEVASTAAADKTIVVTPCTK